MNFNIFKKLFSFSSPSSVSSEDQTKNEEVTCKSPFIIPLKMDPNAYEDNARAFDEKIDVCKEHTDPSRYFNIFAKHLKKFENDGLGKKIALVDLSNIVVDKMIIDLNPKAEYVLIDNFLDYNLLKALAPEASLSLICTDDDGILEQFEKLQKLNINMKFDVVVGNPPYNRGLHLKILAEVMKHLSDEGEVFWLAPIVKWQIATLLELPAPILGTSVISRISMDQAFSLFGIHQRCELGIISNRSKTIIEIVDNLKTLRKIHRKLSSMNQDLLKDHFETEFKEFPIGFGYGCTIAGHGGHGKACYRLTSTKRDRACRREMIGHTRYCNAKTEIEQTRIWQFYSSLMIRFIAKEFGFGAIPYEIIPWIELFKNKDGKTPLEVDWTLFDMCRYFGFGLDDIEVLKNSLDSFLFDDEIKLIEETISRY